MHFARTQRAFHGDGHLREKVSVQARVSRSAAVSTGKATSSEPFVVPPMRPCRPGNGPVQDEYSVGGVGVDAATAVVNFNVTVDLREIIHYVTPAMITCR